MVLQVFFLIVVYTYLPQLRCLTEIVLSNLSLDYPRSSGSSSLGWYRKVVGAFKNVQLSFLGRLFKNRQPSEEAVLWCMPWCPTHGLHTTLVKIWIPSFAGIEAWTILSGQDPEISLSAPPNYPISILLRPSNRFSIGFQTPHWSFAGLDVSSFFFAYPLSSSEFRPSLTTRSQENRASS